MQHHFHFTWMTKGAANSSLHSYGNKSFLFSILLENSTRKIRIGCRSIILSGTSPSHLLEEVLPMEPSASGATQSSFPKCDGLVNDLPVGNNYHSSVVESQWHSNGWHSTGHWQRKLQTSLPKVGVCLGLFVWFSVSHTWLERSSWPGRNLCCLFRYLVQLDLQSFFSCTLLWVCSVHPSLRVPIGGQEPQAWTGT